MSFVTLKVILISTGILSMAMGLKLTVPVVAHFAPSIWTFFLACFTPPYLYILVNFIILTILASSKFHHDPDPPPPLPTDPIIYSVAYDPALIPPLKISGDAQPDYNAVNSHVYIYQEKAMLNDYTVTNGDGYGDTVTNGDGNNDTVTNADGISSGKESVGYVYDENVPVKTTVNSDDAVLAPSLQSKDSSDFAFPNENEKPPVFARFNHKKAVRASPEGGKAVALRVAKPKRQDTLESTWRTITEGKPMPLARHLKKSETMDSQQRRNAVPLSDLNGGSATPVMKKSETFGGRENSASPGSGGRLRKEASPSQDELNRRVEAFINKFNAEMRLQRQESLRQYREMINRGAR